MRPKEEITHNYVCAKCRGTKAHAREATIAKAGLWPFVPSKDNRYLEVTCMLCGYTEFYNRALYIRSQAAEEATEKTLALRKNADRG